MANRVITLTNGRRFEGKPSDFREASNFVEYQNGSSTTKIYNHSISTDTKPKSNDALVGAVIGLGLLALGLGA